jgi:hypothetical protein
MKISHKLLLLHFLIVMAIHQIFEPLLTPHNLSILTLILRKIHKFRFSRQQIRIMFELFKMPRQWAFKSRHSVEGIVGFCIFLRRLATPSTLNSISDFIGYSIALISMVFNADSNHIYDFMKHRIEFDGLYLTKERRLRMARAVYEKGAPLEGCWGFIDGTVRPVSRPVQGQEGIYNGHHRTHALKYQGISSADGMIVSLSGPFVGRDHDMKMLADSDIVNKLDSLDYQGLDRELFIYGDLGYVMSNRIQVPFEGLNLTSSQKKFNRVMSQHRVTVEWAFKNVLQYFGFMRDKYNLKTGKSPVGMYYAVAVIMTNCRNCFYRNQISQYFDCEPAGIYEYLG